MENKLFIFILLSSMLEVLISKVTILAPKALKDKFAASNLKASYSNFGKIPYGYTLTGRIYFDPDNLIEDMACKPINTIKVNKDPTIDTVPIVLIDRGSCNFVDKVKNVEDIGGHVALIVDNRPNEDPTYVIMSDDSKRHGEKVNIPALLISFEDGKVLKDFYRENKNNKAVLDNMILQIEFEMEHTKNKVDYSIYFSSEYFNIYKTLKELYHYHKHLSENTLLKPYYMTIKDISGKESPNCYSNGNYCISPRFDLGINDGRLILKENIRQKCVYNYSYKEKQNSTDYYWNYMGKFHDKCIGNGTEALNFNDACANSVLKDINLEVNDINGCISQSFDLTPSTSESEFNTKENKILAKDREARNEHNIWLIPTILINNRTFWGTWKGENIFEAICASFKNKPTVCFDEGAFKKEKSSLVTGLSNGSLLLIIFMIIFFNLIIFLVCRKYIKRKIAQKVEDTDINHRINTVVTSYLALKDTK